MPLLHGTSVAGASGPNLDQSCPVDSSDTSLASSQRCIAGVVRTTRQRRLNPFCTVDPRALVKEAEYHPGDCYPGHGIGAESIAQARAIAYFNLNAARLIGD